MERSSRTPAKSLGKHTSSFLRVKQMTLHGSKAAAYCVSGLSATSPLPRRAQPPVLKASSGAAQQHGLGSGCRENSPVGKCHAGSLAGSLPANRELLFSSAVPLGSCPSRAGADPDPTTDLASSASSSSLGASLPAAGRAVSAPQLLPAGCPALQDGAPRGCIPAGTAPAPCPDPRPKQPLQRVTNNHGNRTTPTPFSFPKHTKCLQAPIKRPPLILKLRSTKAILGKYAGLYQLT